jgi:subtilisin family serine protease
LSSPRSRYGRAALGLLTTTGLLTGALVGSATAADDLGTGLAAPLTAGPTPLQTAIPKKTQAGDKLGRADRDKLAQAVATGKRAVTVMVAAEKGQDAQARRDLEGLGGTVRYSAPKLGYFSATVPTGSVDKASTLPSILGIDLDEVVALPPERPEAAAKGNLRAPDATTPESNPFMPTNETGSNAFRNANPTYDGRGVTIGILDSGIDLRHPALQTTTTNERKIVDTFTATDPVTEGSLVAGGDASWLPMVQEATGPTFGPYRDATWTLPAGTYRIRTFDEAGTLLPGCEICGDVNRDGDTTDRFGVLYDPVTHGIRVDSDDDKDFRNNPVMQPYGESYQVGSFGTDKPFTDVVEAIPFTVDYREDQSLEPLGSPDSYDFVDIGLASGAHGSHVAGITAAKNMFGGKMDGQAPGAKLVSGRACAYGAGCTAAALTDGMAELAANRGVDIINMSIGGLPQLNDGTGARAELYNRIINDLGVQLVISAGNSGNALNTVGDPSTTTDVVSVGASISKATWKANYGSVVAYDKGMLTFSSGGPREDGGFKPNVTAPGSAISTIPTWQPGAPVAEAGYGLPAGYAMFNGTSMAAPQTAGAMTLLLSAARQSGITATAPAALRRAVYSSAVFNPRVPAFLQGNGEVNVPAAYALLQQELAPDSFTVSAPVCTEIWSILERTTGTGLYNRCAADRGGAVVGQERTYPITVTRTSGARGAGPYALSLLGNDGTYSLGASSVRLPLNQAVTVQVTTKPGAGAHSAVLRMDAAATPAVDAEVMLAVVASPPLAAPGYGTTVSGTSRRNETQRIYVTVPEGAKALQVQLSGLAPNSQTRVLGFHPFGVPMESGSSLVCYSNFSDAAECDPSGRVYADPQPGIWELLVESRRTSPLLDNPFTLKATVLGATVTPPSQTLASVKAGTPKNVSFTVRNDFGTVDASAKGGPLGSVRSDRPTIVNGKQLTRTVVVPAGAERLDVSIGGTSDTGADLDLVVSGPSGQLVSADGDSEESVSYAAPKPGEYTILVDGYSVPAGSTAFDYVDVYVSKALGTLTVPTASFAFASGETRTINGTLTAKVAPAAGRSLIGTMEVTSRSGAVLGSGTVLVTKVAP